MPPVPARPMAQPTNAEAPPRTNTEVAVLAFAGIVVALMQTLVIPLIPELPRLLNATVSDTAWVVTATLLAAAVAIPVVGRLVDSAAPLVDLRTTARRQLLLTNLASIVFGFAMFAMSLVIARYAQEIT